MHLGKGTKARITIVKRTVNRDLIEEYSSDDREECGCCQRYQDGQEFVVESPSLKPKGFCAWAWADIHRDVVAIVSGGSYPWIKQPGTAIACCSDGLKPVIFNVERIE